VSRPDRDYSVVVLEIMGIVSEEIDQAVKRGVRIAFDSRGASTYSSPTLSKFAELHSFRNVSVSSKNQTSLPSIVVSSYTKRSVHAHQTVKKANTLDMGLSGAMRCKLGNTGGFFTCTKKKITIKVKPSVEWRSVR
jgi:hypothetical protein